MHICLWLMGFICGCTSQLTVRGAYCMTLDFGVGDVSRLDDR